MARKSPHPARVSSNKTSRELRLAAPRGSYEAQRHLAAEEADEAAERAKQSPRPDIEAVYAFAAHAFHNAIELILMTRSPEPPTADRFIAHQTRLAEYVSRIVAMPQLADVLATLPQEPGITFGPNWAGDSALDVAIQTAQSIHRAATYSRGETTVRGRSSFDALIVAPTPDPRFEKWRDDFLREMTTATLPAPPAWPMHEVRRDARSLAIRIDAAATKAI